MKKLAILWAITLAFLLTIMGVVHSLDKGRCVDHTHEFGLDGYVLSMAVYFICMAMAYAVYRYYDAVQRK